MIVFWFFATFVFSFYKLRHNAIDYFKKLKNKILDITLIQVLVKILD